MRCLVCSGIERAAAELFNAAETVPGVRPRCSAMVLRVTFSCVFFLCTMVIQRSSRRPSECPADYYGYLSDVEILRSEATALQILRPLAMKIESPGASGGDKDA